MAVTGSHIGRNVLSSYDTLCKQTKNRKKPNKVNEKVNMVTIYIYPIWIPDRAKR